MDTVVLFDIDGTIVTRASTLPTSKQLAFTQALDHVYGVPDLNYMDYPIFGLTDRGILYLLLQKNGLTINEIAEKETVFRRYVLRVHDEIVVGREQQFQALPGACELLEWLIGRKVNPGLATGNFEHLACFKLKEAGLDQYFSFGGFGEDGIDRSDIVSTAIQRAGNTARSRISLLGDTPNDLLSAGRCAIEGFAVATGSFSSTELAAYAASEHHVFTDLLDTDTVGVRLTSPDKGLHVDII